MTGPLGSALEAAGAVHRNVRQNEACVSANVWTPAVDDGGGRPVMVWVHGGAFRGGSAASPSFDGTTLARRGDVVVVSLQYRLGALGFLRLVELGDPTATGNAGLHDLVAGLRWVCDNALTFGGDPGNVTLFGESAGGCAVGTLMSMGAAQGLFHKAVIQSGPPHLCLTVDEAAQYARQVLDVLGLAPDQAHELRRVPVRRLVAASAKVGARRPGRIGMGFAPVVGDADLPDFPIDAVRRGSGAHIPVIVGTNRHEQSIFMRSHPVLANLDGDRLRRIMAKLVGRGGPEIAGLYERCCPDATDAERWMAIEVDRHFRIPTLRFAETRCAGGRAPVWVYVFCWESPILGGTLGAMHALEIPFVFGHTDAAVLGDGVGRDPLSERMMTAWVSFARHGNPNTDTRVTWPPYDLHERPTMVFDVDTRVECDPDPVTRRAWDGVSL